MYAIRSYYGQVMKQTKGQANPEQINHLLRTYLSQDH
ncbi:hypothetical protein [Legionella tunisiensis]